MSSKTIMAQTWAKNNIERLKNLKKQTIRNSITIILIILVLVLGLFIGKASAVETKTEVSIHSSKDVNQLSKEAVRPRFKSVPTSSTTTTTTKPPLKTKKTEAPIATPSKGDTTTLPEDIWQRLANCESGDPAYNGPSGFDGAFQFLPSTWNSMNTGYAFAYEAPFEVQLDAAKRLIQRSGWGQFPACAKKLGML